MKQSSFWYDNTKLLSYNKIYNFVIGNRGGGKSYNAKCWAIRTFLKTGKQFLYLRRYDTELEKVSTFFADVSKEFPDHEFNVEGKTLYIDGRVCGQAMPLSTSQKDKSNLFENIDKIIFDEFIIDKGVYHYIRNEFELFNELYETVARMRRVRVLFVANAISMINPYFQALNIYPRGTFTRGKHWCLEMYANEEYIKAKLNTEFGDMIKDTAYGEYAIFNNFLRDNNAFVEKLPPKANYWFTIKHKGTTYGVWFSMATGYVYVSKKYDPNNRNIYCFTTEDHRPNFIYLKQIKTTTPIRRMRDAYDTGMIRFDSINTKAMFYEIIKLV